MTEPEHTEARAVAITGPTASGKAELGRQASRRLGLPILVCDSVKVYRGLDIGSAKPDAQARSRDDYRLLDLVAPDETFSAGDYSRAAWAELRKTDGRGLFVGGTGFYLRGVGWTQSAGERPGVATPPDDPKRVAFETAVRDAETREPGSAHRALTAADPELADTIHPRNLVRLLRALWLVQVHGGSVSAQRKADPPRPRLHLLLVVLDPGPAALSPRIGARLDRMLDRGFLGEVETLHAAGYDGKTKAMRSLGYRQMLEVVEGRSTVAQAREAIVIATRQYAKRQRTFVRTQLPAESVVTIASPAACPWPAIEAFMSAPNRRAP